MKEHIKVLKEFKNSPLSVLEDEKKSAKLTSAINKSIKLLQKEDSRKKASKRGFGY